MPKKAGTEAAPEARKLGVLPTITNLDGPPPRSAWFVFGSDSSFMSDDDLYESLGAGEWTSSKHAKKGDTLFFYFIAPYLAVHFVARASRDAYSDWQSGRWCIEYESMVRIKPISSSEIRELFDEKRLLFYCRDGKWIRPDFANRLLDHMVVKYRVEREDVHRVRQHVVGNMELGKPASITLDELRQLNSSHFICEEEVEYHVLDPLLRIGGIHGEAKIVRKWDLPNNRTADYAVLDNRQKVLCIIEAKLNLGKRSNWQRNPHVRQAREYAKMCKAPGFVVMDRDRIVCFRTPDELPCLVVDRATLDESGLSALRAHILNENRVHPNDRQDRPSSKTRPRRRGR